MLTEIIVRILTVTAMLTAAPDKSKTEQALICHGCDYQQAKSLALDNVAPLARCEESSGSVSPHLNVEMCFSQPQKIIIFDAVSRQTFPFVVYHANQGESVSDLRSSITTRDYTVHPTVIELLNTGTDMHTELTDSYDDIATRLVSDLNSGKIKLN